MAICITQPNGPASNNLHGNLPNDINLLQESEKISTCRDPTSVPFVLFQKDIIGFRAVFAKRCIVINSNVEAFDIMIKTKMILDDRFYLQPPLKCGFFTPQFEVIPRPTPGHNYSIDPNDPLGHLPIDLFPLKTTGIPSNQAASRHVLSTLDKMKLEAFINMLADHSIPIINNYIGSLILRDTKEFLNNSLNSHIPQQCSFFTQFEIVVIPNPGDNYSKDPNYPSVQVCKDIKLLQECEQLSKLMFPNCIPFVRFQKDLIGFRVVFAKRGLVIDSNVEAYNIMIKTNVMFGR